MSATAHRGIDYGLGKTNVDKKTGFRYGVISVNNLPYWYDSAEVNYGEPHCPICGNEAQEYAGEDMPDQEDEWTHAKYECSDYVCQDCQYVFGSESAYGEEPNSWFRDDKDCKAEQGGDDRDVFILQSDYFTYAAFCSPCAPGACYLTSYLEEPHENNKAYCPPPDWFDDNAIPFPIYSVDTGELVAAPTQERD